MPPLRHISLSERKVVGILREFRKEELTCYEITKKFYPDAIPYQIMSRSTFIRKVLQDLLKRGIIIKINSYPTFYKISNVMRNRKYETIFYEVECPSCNKKHWIMDGSQTKQCTCLKDNGKPRRFWLYPNRYTGEKKIV